MLSFFFEFLLVFPSLILAYPKPSYAIHISARISSPSVLLPDERPCLYASCAAAAPRCLPAPLCRRPASSPRHQPSHRFLPAVAPLRNTRDLEPKDAQLRAGLARPASPASPTSVSPMHAVVLQTCQRRDGRFDLAREEEGEGREATREGRVAQEILRI